MLVATDPFGGLWMVSMVDVLNDLKDEFNSTIVSLPTLSEALKMRSYIRSTLPIPVTNTRIANSSSPEDNMSTSTLSNHELTTQPDHWDDPSLPANSLNEGDVSAMQIVPSSVLDVPQSVAPESSLQTSAPSLWQNVPSYEDLGSKNEGSVWYCGNCGDGPYAGWQLSCQMCFSPRMG
jgi:hypothetical protein